MRAETTGADTPVGMLRSGFELHQPPVAALQSFMTPLADMFYVLHLGVADMSARPWSLEIGGLVEKPTTLTWAARQELPARRIVAAHECAGNPLFPKKPVRRVGNVEWEGVPLAAVLSMAGVMPAPGKHCLLCRATANDGAVQPASGARNEWFSIRFEALAAPNYTEDAST